MRDSDGHLRASANLPMTQLVYKLRTLPENTATWITFFAAPKYRRPAEP